MRSANPKPSSGRKEPFPSVPRPRQVFVLCFKASEILIERIVMGTMDDVGQLECGSIWRLRSAATAKGKKWDVHSLREA